MKCAALRKYIEQCGYGGDYRREENPRCPHCGETYNISDHDAWHLYGGEDGDEIEVSCGVCDLDFTVTVNVSHSFSTDEQPDEDDDDSKPAEEERG